MRWIGVLKVGVWGIKDRSSLRASRVFYFKKTLPALENSKGVAAF
jgi:hypothetical protein